MLFDGIRFKWSEGYKNQINYEVSNTDKLFEIIEKEGFRYLGTSDLMHLVFVKEIPDDDLEFIDIIEVKEA